MRVAAATSLILSAIGTGDGACAAGTRFFLPAGDDHRRYGRQSGVGTNTSIAVKLLSRDRAQTGTATLTHVAGGVNVQVVLDQPPAGPAMATIVKGSCPALAGGSMSGKAGSAASSSGMSGAGGSASGMPGAGTSGSGMPGASTSGPSNFRLGRDRFRNDGSGTSASGTAASAMPDAGMSARGSTMGSGSSMPSSAMSSASYPIGKVTASQGGQGQTSGIASTMLKSASLTSLTAVSYVVAIGNGTPAATSAMLCGDIRDSADDARRCKPK